jgi:hypothetical protein
MMKPTREQLLEALQVAAVRYLDDALAEQPEKLQSILDDGGIVRLAIEVLPHFQVVAYAAFDKNRAHLRLGEWGADPESASGVQ